MSNTINKRFMVQSIDIGTDENGNVNVIGTFNNIDTARRWFSEEVDIVWDDLKENFGEDGCYRIDDGDKVQMLSNDGTVGTEVIILEV